MPIFNSPQIMIKDQESAKAYLQSLTGSDVRVTLTDTREVYGSLHCVDNSSNLILYDVRVALPSAPETPPQTLSSAMVNGRHISKIELKK